MTTMIAYHPRVGAGRAECRGARRRSPWSRTPWVRGTVAQQKATGHVMQLTAAGRTASWWLGSSPVAGVVEIHEMAMDNNVMKMRARSRVP
jgi:copper(I)-binding protein